MRQLFDPGPVSVESLTAQQRRVYEAVGRDGITANEAGQLLYPNSPIAHTYGRAVLQRLKALGLVVERRNPPRYELTHTAPEPVGDLPADF